MQKKHIILLGRYFISLYTHGLTPLRIPQMSLTLQVYEPVMILKHSWDITRHVLQYFKFPNTR